MKVTALDKDIQSLKRCLDGKRRIMTYGAGTWANDIKKMLDEYGYTLDYALVDAAYCDGNTYMERGGVSATATERLNPPYSPETDALIWAIASPDKLRSCMEDDRLSIQCLLPWNMFGFWQDKEYFSKHEREFGEACELLCDEYSKKVFWGYLEAQKGNIDDDILYSTSGTYFNELTRVKRNGAFVDCGAYDGENAAMYMKFVGEECKVYAFEPDQENYQNMADRMKDRASFICLNKGCWSSETTLSFHANGDMSSSLSETGDEVVEVTTIDKAVGDEKVAFIKMDIEGAELEALKGAGKVIEQDMPILAISAYHKQEDLITLLPYISRLCNESEKYDLYLRHHGVVQTELVIYAIPGRKTNVPR